MTRLFGSAGGVSVGIAGGVVGGPLNFLIFFIRQVLQSFSVLIQGLCDGHIRPERGCAWRINCGDRFCRVISPLQCGKRDMGRKVHPWGWAVSAANNDDAGGHRIPAHIAGCIKGSRLVTCTLASWDLDLSPDYLRRIELGNKCPRLCSCLFLLHYGGAGLLVTFPEGMVSRSPGHALELGHCVFHTVVR